MNPRTVEEVIMDFKSRRAGIIKALTTDVEVFYKLCDPKHPSLCLYGLSSQRWKVDSPPLPPSPLELPEPRLGINVVRDDMPKDEWLSMVALHSDTWLHGVASYFSVKNKFDKADRKRLFNKISDVGFVSEVITGGTRRKKSKVESRGLPEEIVVEVLARLPVKDLLRYRSACNKWRCLIDDPNFVTAHLGSYKSNVIQDRLIVCVERPGSNSERVLVRHSDTFRLATTLRNLNVDFQYDIVSYVHGLVLVRKRNMWSYSSEIIIWNPSINKSFNVPDMSIRPIVQPSYYEFGLGFDASMNNYKMVLFAYPYWGLSYYLNDRRYCAMKPGIVQVYSLSTNCWTMTKSGIAGARQPLHWAVGSQVYFNGAIHWMGFGPRVVNYLLALNQSCSHIVSFDLGNEVFNYLELPIDVIDSGKSTTYVTVMEDCLAIFCIHDRLHDIWVLKENMNSNSWSKCYTFQLTYDKGLNFRRNGEFLYAVDGVGIKSYDVKRNCVRDLAKTYCKTSTYTIFTYLESLTLSTLNREDSQVRTKPKLLRIFIRLRS